MREDRFTWTDDSQFNISQCAYCRHKGNGKFCTAYEEIPMKILLNQVDHRQPYTGDNGIQFEPNNGVNPSKLDRLFELLKD